VVGGVTASLEGHRWRGEPRSGLLRTAGLPRLARADLRERRAGEGACTTTHSAPYPFTFPTSSTMKSHSSEIPSPLMQEIVNFGAEELS